MLLYMYDVNNLAALFVHSTTKAILPGRKSSVRRPSSIYGVKLHVYPAEPASLPQFPWLSLVK